MFTVGSEIRFMLTFMVTNAAVVIEHLTVNTVEC